MAGVGVSDQMAELRRSVGELTTSLALHDQKVDGNVDRVVATQERMESAVERFSDKVSEATLAIKSLTEQMKKSNGNGHSAAPMRLDRNTILWILGGIFLGSAGIGSGQEIALRLLKAFAGGNQ